MFKRHSLKNRIKTFWGRNPLMCPTIWRHFSVAVVLLDPFLSKHDKSWLAVIAKTRISEMGFDYSRSVEANEWRQIAERRHCAGLQQRGSIIKQCSNPTALRPDLERR